MRRSDGIPIRSRRTWNIRVEVLIVKQSPASARSIEFDIEDSLELSKIFTAEAILAMAPFCSRSDNSMDVERHSVSWDQENGDETVGSGSTFVQDLTHRGSLRTFSLRTSSHKSSQDKFLNWVAYVRNLSPAIHEIEKRTCPLIDCEKCFYSPEGMLQHVQNCTRLSKGRYRCFESGAEARIGRCQTKSCQKLQECKNGLVNSLRRRLSPRGPGAYRPPQIPFEKETLSPEISQVDSRQNKLYPVGKAELSIESNIAIPELDPSFIPEMPEMSGGSTLELYGCQSYMSSFQHGPLSELDSSRFPAELHGDNEHELVELAASENWSNSSSSCTLDPYGSVEHREFGLGSDSDPAELGSNDDLGSMAEGSLDTHHQHAWEPAPSMSLDSADDWQGYISAAGDPLPMLHTHDVDILFDQHYESMRTSESYDRVIPDDLVSPMGSVIWDNSNNSGVVSPIGSGTSSDASWVNSLYSSTSSLSTRDTSMTSLKPNQTPATTSDELIVRILDDREMLCDEPEEMEPVLIAEDENIYNPWKTQHAVSPKMSPRRGPRFNLPCSPDSYNHTYRQHAETNTPPPPLFLVRELSDTQSLLQPPPPDTSSSPGSSSSIRRPSPSVVSSSPNSKALKIEMPMPALRI